MSLPLRVAVVYNRYVERGGEDEVFEAECQLLESAGVQVLRIEAKAQEPRGALEKLRAGADITWSNVWRREVSEKLEGFKPDIMHVHNWFPTMSPSILWEARAKGVPVVATLHNYRLLCVRSTLYRDGAVCERCLGLPAAVHGVRYGCYQSSRMRSAALAIGQLTHNALGTWDKCISVFITPSQFAKEVFVRAKFPSEQIQVKSNFLNFDPGPGEGDGDYVFFAGRLSEEKGVLTLLAAVEARPSVKFLVAGNGPLAEEVRGRSLANLELVGRKARTEVMDLIRGSRAVVVPSEWYEQAFPLIGIEAFACGRTVIGSRIGAVQEGIDEGVNGLLFNPGDSLDLAARIDSVWDGPGDARRMGSAARAHYERDFSADQNLKDLLAIYEQARGASSGR